MAIHLGVHNHLIADGKCKESLEETRKLIVEKVDRTTNTKMFVISLRASKTFLVKHMFDDCSDDKVELLKGEQLE
jgi:hypothetical protein